MTQKADLLNYLRTHAEVTPMDALRDLGIFRLAARIHELRADGHIIAVTEPEGGDKRYAIYSLVSKEATA